MPVIDQELIKITMKLIRTNKVTGSVFEVKQKTKTKTKTTTTKEKRKMTIAKNSYCFFAS